MAYRFSGADPQVKFLPGGIVGQNMGGSPQSFAALLKRNAIGAWMSVLNVANGSTNVSFPLEFRPENSLESNVNTSESGKQSTPDTFTSTTEWEIVGFTWDGSATASAFVFRWKVGAAAWGSRGDTSLTATNTVTSGHRLLVGIEAAGLDDLSADVVCMGMTRSTLSQATFESLSMTDFATWEAVFTGANSWLVGFEDAGTVLDRTGNSGDETSRNGVSLVSDPAGWSWGGLPDSGTYIGDDTIGDGTIGLRGAGSTPKVGVETFTVSDIAVNAPTLARTDSATLTDIALNAPTLTTTDSAALTDAALPAPTLTRTDAGTLTDAALYASALAATEAGTMGDASSPSASLALTDAFTLAVETAVQLIQEAKVGSESFTLTDAVTALSATLATLETGAVTDTSALQAQQNRVDSATAGEVAGVAATLSAAEAAALAAEVAALQQGYAATDSFILSAENRDISANPAVLDTLSVVDAAVLTALLAKNDSWSVTEAAAVAQQALLAASDAFALAEQTSLLQAVLLAANDSFVLSETYALVAQLNRTDAQTLTDVSALAQSQAKTASDSITLGELAVYNATLSALEAFALQETANQGGNQFIGVSDALLVSEALTLAGSLTAVDSHSLTDLASLTQSLAKAAADSGSVSEALTLKRGCAGARHHRVLRDR